MELATIRRIIFAVGNGITRAPMAAGAMQQLLGSESTIEVLPRGLIVAFPEPLNQKTEVILVNNGITFEDFSSKILKNEEITDKTIIFTMEETSRQQILLNYDSANEGNTFVLSHFVGEELETMDPIGGNLAAYGLCFETIRNSLEKFMAMLEEAKEEQRGKDTREERSFE